jgi:CheY-like chemotaxis protein
MEQEGQIQGHIPIIAVTANARGEQSKLLEEQGAWELSQEPIKRDEEFMSALETAPTLAEIVPIYSANSLNSRCRQRFGDGQ